MTLGMKNEESIMVPKGDFLKNISRFILLIWLISDSDLSADQSVNQASPKHNDIEVNAENLDANSMILGKKSTIDDYLAYAALNNPKLKAVFDEWKTALYRISQVRSLPDPKFNYAYFIREVETRVGAQEQKFGLSQMFPWFGKLQLKEDMAYEAANSAEQRYEAEKLKLFYQVKHIYYDYYYLFRAIDITKKNMKLLLNLEAVARAKLRSGSGVADAVKAQVELGKLEDKLKSMNELREPIALKFNAILNRPLNADVPWPQSAEVTPVTIVEEELFDSLTTNNPELRALDYQKAKEEVSTELAKKNFYPDFMLGLDYVVTDDAINPTSDSGKDPVMAMFSINLPIWRGKYKAALNEAKSRYSTAENQRYNAENQILADLKMAYYHFRDAERKINLFKDTLIPKAQQSLNVVQKSYESGSTEFLSLIDAERLLLEFELSYERAVANRMQRLAELEMLVGKSLPFKKEARDEGQGWKDREKEE